MTRDGHLFRRSVGEIVAGLLRAKFNRDTAKAVERRYEIEPSTAKNVIKGHVSERSLTSILHGEGEDVFELLDAIGHALTGMTHDQWEEKKFNQIIEEAERAENSIRRLHSRRALLAESTQAVGEADARIPADPPRPAETRSFRSAR